MLGRQMKADTYGSVEHRQKNVKSCRQLKFVVRGCRRKIKVAKREAISQTAAFYFTVMAPDRNWVDGCGVCISEKQKNKSHC